MRDGDKYFSWSPDSQWLLVEFDRSLNNADVHLLDASGDQPIKILGGYYDRSPKWANEGKQMIWFSIEWSRAKGRAVVQNTMSIVCFTQEGWDEYQLSEEEFKLQQAIEEAQKASKDGEKDKAKEKDGTDVKNEKIIYFQLIGTMLKCVSIDHTLLSIK